MSERYRGEYEDSEAARYDAEKAAHDDEMEQREILALRASEAALSARVKVLEEALREIAEKNDYAEYHSLCIARRALAAEEGNKSG